MFSFEFLFKLDLGFLQKFGFIKQVDKGFCHFPVAVAFSFLNFEDHPARFP